MTTRAELEELVEAPAAYTPPSPDTLAVVDGQFVLRMSMHGTWASVQRVRLHDVDAALAAVRAHAHDAIWWLSDRTTPADAEELLLARGLVRAHEYELDGMLLTTPPPPGPRSVVVRPVADGDEHVAAVEAQWLAFGTPAARRVTQEQLREEHELERSSNVVVLYAAWLDGEVVGAGRGIFTPRGVLLAGGAVVPAVRGRGVYRALVRARWDAAAQRGTRALAVQAGSMSAPILRRLGFRRVCAFRRLEDVVSAASRP